MKRSRLKKQSKQSISKLQRLIWKECKRIADIIYPPIRGQSYCYICGRLISGSNKQLSHLIPKSVCGAFLKYDVFRNLKWCCFNCNINLGGNLAEYYRKMLKENGQKYMDQLYIDKQRVINARGFFETLLVKYKYATIKECQRVFIKEEEGESTPPKSQKSK